MKKQRTIYFIILVLLLALSVITIAACSDPRVPDKDNTGNTVDGTQDVNDAEDNIVTNGTFASAYNDSGNRYVKKDNIKGWTAKTGSAIYTDENDKNTSNTTFGLVQGVIDLENWNKTNGINKTLYGSDEHKTDMVNFASNEITTNVQGNTNTPYDDSNALIIASDMSGDIIYESSSYFYTSTTFTAEKGKSYVLSIDVLTLLLNGVKLDKENDGWNSEDYGRGANIVVTDSNNSYALNSVEAINTYGEWKTIEIYIEANKEGDIKIGLQLWMGHGTAYVQSGTVNERLTKGVCLFDNVIMRETTSTKYQEAEAEVLAKMGTLDRFNNVITAPNTTYYEDVPHVLSLTDWATSEKYALYSYASKSSTSTSYDYYYTARVGNPSAYTVMKGVENYSDYSSEELPYYSSSSYLPYGIFDYSKVYVLDGENLVDEYATKNKTDWAGFPTEDFYTGGDFDNNAFKTAFPGVTQLDTRGLLIYNNKPSGVGYEISDMLTIEKGKYYTVSIYTYLYQALRLDTTASDVSLDDADKNMERIKTFNTANRTVKATSKMTDVTFDGQNSSASYEVVGYAAYAEQYRQSILNTTTIDKAIRDKWEALGVITSLPTEKEYYYTLDKATTYKVALSTVSLPAYSEGGWEKIEYNISGNSLGDREMGMQLWLGEGLKDADTLVMGGAIFADITIEESETPVGNTVYRKLSSFDAGVDYDIYGLTSGALKQGDKLVGSYRTNTLNILDKSYVIYEPAAGTYEAYEIGTASVGKFDYTSTKLTITEAGTEYTRYIDVQTGKVYAEKQKKEGTELSSEAYYDAYKLYKNGSVYYYTKDGKVYNATLNTTFVKNGNSITLDGNTYSIAVMSESYKDASEFGFDFKAADGLYNSGSVHAYVLSSTLDENAWETTPLKDYEYPYLDDELKAADDADINTQFATIAVEHASASASILTLGDATDYIAGAKVYPNKYYRYSILVKTDKENVGTATLQLIAWNTNADKTTTTSLKSVSSIDTEGEWVEYVFYVSGAYVEDRDFNALTSQVLFGSGDAYSPSTHAKGVVYLTAPTFIEVTYSEYSSKNTGENVNSYSYSSSLYTSETVTNGRFTSVDYDKTLDANADYDINAYDDNGKLIGIGTPSGGWTAVDSDYDKMTTPKASLEAVETEDAYAKIDIVNGQDGAVVSNAANKDTVTMPAVSGAYAYVLYRKDRKSVAFGDLPATSIIKNGIEIKVNGNVVTIVVSNSTQKEYSNYILSKSQSGVVGTTAFLNTKPANEIHDAEKGTDTVTFTIGADDKAYKDWYLYYDTDEWYSTSVYSGTALTTDVINNTPIEYIYGYSAVTEVYEENMSGVKASADGTGTKIEWTATSLTTNKFLKYVIEVDVAGAKTEFDVPNAVEKPYTVNTHTISRAYDAAEEATYTVKAVWYVDDAKRAETKEFTITWSNELKQTGNQAYENFYKYEVYFVPDGESSQDKYFVGFATLESDAPSTSSGVTTHKYTYVYKLQSLVRGTYYIRAVVDSALYDQVIDATKDATLTYGQKYCPSGYATVYVNPDQYIVDGKYWINWSSATFSKFENVQGGATNAVAPSGYSGMSIEDFKTKAPVVPTADAGKEQKSSITYAGIISSADFDKDSVFQNSANNTDFIAALNEIYPTEGLKYNDAAQYERSQTEKDAGIWSFGYSDTATDFYTVNKKYDNLLMIASDVDTVKGYTSSSSTTLTASSYYVLSFWIKTTCGAKASIILDNQSNIYNANDNFDGFRSVSTNNEWVQYRLLIKVGFNDAQIKVGLYLGEPNESADAVVRSSGIVFFDDINFIKLADEAAYTKYLTTRQGKEIKSYMTQKDYINQYDAVEATTIYSNGFVYETLDYVTDSFDVHKDDAKAVLGNTPKDYTQAMDTGDDNISNDNETRAYGVYNQSNMESSTDLAAYLKSGNTDEDDNTLRNQDWYTINTTANLRSFVQGYGSNSLVLANFTANAQYMKSSSKSLETESYYQLTFYAKALLAPDTFAEFRLYRGTDSTADYQSIKIYGVNEAEGNEYGFYKYTMYTNNATDSSISAYYSFHLGKGAVTDTDDNGVVSTVVPSELIMGLLVIDNVTLTKIDQDTYEDAVGTTETAGSLKALEAADADAYSLGREGYFEMTKVTSDTESDDTTEDNSEEEDNSWGAETWLILSSAVIGLLILIVVVIFMVKQFKKKYVKVKVIGENKVDAEKKSEFVVKQQKQSENTAYVKERKDFEED